uniref:Auxin-responsive protein n=1 Tax=Araucaria cunninghamii TaxID=56994 RepID=A0A0D6QTX5_ARACU
MPNLMLDASTTVCSGEKDSQTSLNDVGEVRSRDEGCRDDCESALDSQVGLSSGGNGEEEDTGLDRQRPETVGSSYVDLSGKKEHDYIGYSEVVFGRKWEVDRNLANLGPKTRDTELRLGLPEEDTQDHDVPGSPGDDYSIIPSMKAPNQGLGLSVPSPVFPHASNSLRGVDTPRPRVTGESIRYLHRQQQLFLRAEVGGFLSPHQARISADEGTRGMLYQVKNRNYPSVDDFEQQKRTLFQEFATPDMHKEWLKHMRNPSLEPGFRAAEEQNGRASYAGAKRVFSDTVKVRPGVSGATHESDPRVLSSQPHKSPLPPPTFMFPFACEPNNWHMKWEQDQSRAKLRHLSDPIGPNCRPTLATETLGDKRNEAFSSDVKSVSNPTGLPEKKPKPVESEHAQTDNGAPSEPRAAPVVGWPPIRSFRRNLASQPKPAPVAPPPDPAPAPAPAPPPPAAAPADAGQKKSGTMFVKVNVEGHPIGRKIDLKAYNSYEQLSVGLDEMFRAQLSASNPISSENKRQPSLLSGGDYVLVYEDDEGDQMLVGDVPWGMFVCTVKRLRAMKSSEARRLGSRTKPPLNGGRDEDPKKQRQEDMKGTVFLSRKM